MVAVKDEEGVKDTEGKKTAEQRERVRRVARRGVREGFALCQPGKETQRRLVEAIGNDGRKLGVDVSFARGEWGIRWQD